MEAFSDITAPTVYIYMLILVVYVCEKKNIRLIYIDTIYILYKILECFK